MAARLSRRIAVEQRTYTMRVGWRTPRVDSFKLAELAYTRIENAYKVRKKTFVLQCLCGCYMYNYCENRTDTRLCEPLGSICPEPSQKVFTGGTLRLCREA